MSEHKFVYRIRPTPAGSGDLFDRHTYSRESGLLFEVCRQTATRKRFWCWGPKVRVWGDVRFCRTFEDAMAFAMSDARDRAHHAAAIAEAATQGVRGFEITVTIN